MPSSLYNNPLFAQGLSDIVRTYVGNPNATAQAELAASQAGLNADTSFYRQQIGEAGSAKNLAGVLVAALQAGKGFSSEAPTIASSLASLPSYGFDRATQGNIQVGTGTQKARDTFSGLSQVLAGRGGGGSGGGGGGQPMSSTNRLDLQNLMKLNQDISPQIRAEYSALVDSGMTPDDVVGDIAGRLQPSEVVSNPAGTGFSRAFGPDDDPDAGLPGTSFSRGLGWLLGSGSPQQVEPGPLELLPRIDTSDITNVGAAPSDPSQLVVGQTYRSPTGQIGKWTGTGWEIQ